MAGVSTYSDEMADKICERIADGESLRAICSEDEFPDKATVFRWLRSNEGFCDQYARAREAQAEAFYDELISIADDGSNDWMQKTHGEEEFWVENGEAMRRSQLRIETRKWAMSKVLSRKYGEKVTQEFTGEVIARVVNDL